MCNASTREEGNRHEFNESRRLSLGGGTRAVVLALLPLVAACAESRLADADGTELMVDGTMPELDAGVDLFTRPPRVYPPLYDPAVGADETSVPLCEFPDVNVLGPLGAACSGMDNPCGRGIRQPEGCCRLEPRYRGTACGDGLMCDDWGACVPRTGDPPMEANGVVGTVGWIDARPESGSLFHVDPRGARFNFGHDPAVELVPTADEVIGPLSRSTSSTVGTMASRPLRSSRPR